MTGNSGLEARICSRAAELGFHQVGFAPAAPPPSAPSLEPWIAQEYAGQMEYMVRDPERRKDPTVYWPEARSLVLLSTSYAPVAPDRPLETGHGRVARYARGRDYHMVLKERLHDLGRFIQAERPGARYIAVVDSSAILERAHAVRAGLGWFGKNSMLLSRTHGSYTLIGCLLVNVELSAGAPVTDHCGTCRRCLDACPTQAIVDPGVVDSRRCISYLTIELRGRITPEHRHQMNGWVFGCDICQEVCPWVKKAQPPGAGALHPTSERESISLLTLVSDSQPQFAARWKGSSLKRSKRSGLARNATVLAGTVPDREVALQILRVAMADPEPVVRQEAAWGLGEQGGREAREILDRSLSREESLPVRDEIQMALSRAD